MGGSGLGEELELGLAVTIYTVADRIVIWADTPFADMISHYAWFRWVSAPG